MAAVVLGLLAIALGVAGVLALRSASTPMPIKEAATAQVQEVRTGPSTQRIYVVPERAWQALRLIDAGTWPGPASAPGPPSGETWHNRAGQLAPVDQTGTPITYREWDVDPEQESPDRDADRIVTGSDRSAWYSGDHYRTFTRMR